MLPNLQVRTSCLAAARAEAELGWRWPWECGTVQLLGKPGFVSIRDTVLPVRLLPGPRGEHWCLASGVICAFWFLSLCPVLGKGRDPEKDWRELIPMGAVPMCSPCCQSWTPWVGSQPHRQSELPLTPFSGKEEATTEGWALVGAVCTQMGRVWFVPLTESWGRCKPIPPLQPRLAWSEDPRMMQVQLSVISLHQGGWVRAQLASLSCQHLRKGRPRP